MSSDREEDTLPVTDAAAEAEEPSSSDSESSESDQEPQPSSSTQPANGGGGAGGAVVLPKASLRRIAFLKRTKQLERAKQLEEQLTKKAIREQRILQAKLQGRKRPARKRKRNADYSNTDMTVVFDLSFEDMMNDKQIEKCAHELKLIYEMNRRTRKPIPLYWTGIPAGGAMEKHMARHDANRNWDVKYSSQSFVDLFNRNRLVYLTRDSDEVLTKLEKGTVYVIGGLVDPKRNGNCLELATAMNIRHARLPLREHIFIQNHQTVLSITQVFEILMKIHQGRSWKRTLRKVLIAKRKPKPVDTAERTKKTEESADNGMAVQ